MSLFEQFESSFHKHFTRNPNRRVFLGLDQDLGQLPDPSLSEAHACAAEANKLLTEMKAIDQTGLDFDQSIDLELAQLMLASEVHELTWVFNDRTRHQQLPEAGDGIGDPIFFMFTNDPRPDGDRLKDITDRLKQVPDYLNAMIDRLDHPIDRWRTIELEKLDGLPLLFDSVNNWAEHIQWTDRDSLKSAAENATDAMKAYGQRLQEMPTEKDFHLGDQLTRELVSLSGIELSLEQLHELATHFLAQNAMIIDGLHERLVERYDLALGTDVAGLQNQLNRHFRVQIEQDGLDSILDRYRTEQDRILEFIDKQSLFPIPADQEMRILRTPSFMEPTIPAGAMEPPAPFRDGTRTSLVYLTLAESLLDEHTELSIPGMMLHEGIPGHHLHFATAAAHRSTIRRHMDATDQCEGWTTMLEDYLLDIGLMGDLTDEARFIAKREINRIGARVGIDLFFMTGDRTYLDVGVPCDISPDDPFEAAGNLLQAVTGFTPDRVQAELNWYSLERGVPLGYLTGNHLVWELKRDVAAAQKGALEGTHLDRRFHKVFLESGNMPVAFLRRVFEHNGLLTPST